MYIICENLAACCYETHFWPICFNWCVQPLDLTETLGAWLKFIFDLIYSIHGEGRQNATSHVRGKSQSCGQNSATAMEPGGWCACLLSNNCAQAWSNGAPWACSSQETTPHCSTSSNSPLVVKDGLILPTRLNSSQTRGFSNCFVYNRIDNIIESIYTW